MRSMLAEPRRRGCGRFGTSFGASWRQGVLRRHCRDGDRLGSARWKVRAWWPSHTVGNDVFVNDACRWPLLIPGMSRRAVPGRVRVGYRRAQNDITVTLGVTSACVSLAPAAVGCRQSGCRGERQHLQPERTGAATTVVWAAGAPADDRREWRICCG
jgi:hypothetical protein